MEIFAIVHPHTLGPKHFWLNLNYVTNQCKLDLPITDLSPRLKYEVSTLKKQSDVSLSHCWELSAKCSRNMSNKQVAPGFISHQVPIFPILIELLFLCFHQNPPQEHSPSLKWWNLILSLTIISTGSNLDTSRINKWQSSQILRFFTILIVHLDPSVSNPNNRASFSLWPISSLSFSSLLTS